MTPWVDGRAGSVTLAARPAERSAGAYLLAVAALALAASAWIDARASVVLIPVVGFVLLFELARRRTADPRLAAIVLTSYTLHVALGVVLFVTSTSHLPILTSLQLGEGFWAFAADSDGYHRRALEIIRDTRAGRLMIPITPTGSYSAFVAVLYAGFGPNPLVPVLFNAWLAGGAALLAHALAQRLGGGERGALVATLLVSMWPSTFIWSSQLLREAILAFFLFAVLAAAGAMLAPGRQGWRTAALGLLVASLTFGLGKFRIYTGLFMVVAAISVTLLSLLALGCSRGTPQSAVRAAAFTVSLVAGVYTATGSAVHSWATSAVQATSSVQPVVEPQGESRGAAMGWWAPGWTLSEAALDFLDRKRSDFARGASAIIPEAKLTNWTEVVLLLPRTVPFALFGPFPWQWFAWRGSTGAFVLAAGMEAMIFALLFPAVVRGGARLARRGSPIGWFVLIYGVVAMVSVSLVIANLGSLFRLRLQFVLPLLVLAACGDVLRPYKRLVARLRPAAGEDGGL